MVRFSRLLGYVSVVGCLLWLLLACAPEPASGEAVPTLADSGGVESDRATATPKPVTPVPRGSLYPVTTPDVTLLTQVATLVQEEVENMPTADVSPGLQIWVDQAVADLAERLTIDVGQIEVVEVKAMVWPDGSLGCPEPGVAYTQVQREGTLIRLRVGKRVYQYHSGGGRPPFLCEHPSLPEDGSSSPGLGID
jgi:hypothetical protein